MNDQTAPTIDQLIEVAEKYKYVGERLLHSEVSGYEAGRLWECIQFVQRLFVDLDGQIKNHPDFDKRLAEQQAKGGDNA